MAAAESPAAKAPAALPRWTPTIPTNLMGIFNPFANDDANKPDAEPASTSAKKPSLFSAIFASNAEQQQPPAAPPSPAPRPDDDSIMFAEPDTRSNSEGGSREGSVDGSGKRRARKCDKSKTCYSICHPPPTSTKRHRMHRRPRSLLQLHRLSSNARPQPAFDVIPSANFSVKLTKAITKVFRAKHGLCPNDLVVLQAEKYSADELEEEQEARDIIALICKGRKEDGQYTGKARICFANGAEWEAYPTPAGGYEFFTTDEHGLGVTVRWVAKRQKDGSKATEASKKKFNFSTISPNSRRHPVIACLDRTSLNVNDTFRMPDPAAATPLSTPKQSSSLLADAMAEEAEETDLCHTDDRLREIIVVSGLFVAFKEGWSPTFKYDDKDKDAISLQRSPSLSQSPSKGGASASSPLSTPPASPGPASPTTEKRNSFHSVNSMGMWRRSSLLAKGNRNSVPEEEFEDPPAPSPPLDTTTSKKPGRARADSASTVLVHRAASNRAARNSRQEALASQPEIKEPPSMGDQGRSQSDGAVLLAAATTTTPQRPEPLARPILPSGDSADSSSATEEEAEETAGATAAVPSRSRRQKSPAVGKRESSTTSATTSSTTEALKTPAGPVKKKKSGLRRLLCGRG